MYSIGVSGTLTPSRITAREEGSRIRPPADSADALLRAARRVKDYRGSESDRDTVLDGMFDALHGGRFLEEQITRAIPVIVGATDATKILRGGISVGVDASQGLVYNAASRNNSELKGEE